jgi:poly(3-hydroxybutyrate) depolymerase
MKAPHVPKREHTVPWFWPMAAGVELAGEGLKAFTDNLRFAAEAEAIAAPPPPSWATPNRILLDLRTMALRDFSRKGVRGRKAPVLILAPYAGHHATIADYRRGQSLVETLLDAGLSRVLVTDWKGATEEMKYFDIDTYLAELAVAVDDLGEPVHLVGLCQGGWMSAMFAARYPQRVASLVLAGAPIDTQAGDGAVRKAANELPMTFYEEMVAAGGGLMRGKVMLAGWKNMHAGEQYLEKYVDLYSHIEDRNYISRTKRFERWYENPIDLPGKWYLQAIRELFKENRLAHGKFVALGRRISLASIKAPAYLLAGDADDITPSAQVFNAQRLLGTPRRDIVKRIAPGGHIGLFMGTRTLREAWPEIAAWMRKIPAKRPGRGSPG